MKNGILIWNVILTLVAGYLLISKFSGQSKGGVKGKAVKDSLNAGGQFRMAYFEMDSVAANFDLVKEVKAELAKKENDINSELDRRTKDFQQRYSVLQNKAQAGNMSQAELDAATAEIKKLDDDIKTRRQQLDQEYNQLMASRQNDIKTKIENYLREYNKTKNFSYIISYEQGLFYFKDTAFNITADVIKGLNSFYKPAKAN